MKKNQKTVLVGMQLFLPTLQWDSLCKVPQVEGRFRVEAFPEKYDATWDFPQQHLWSYRSPKSACSAANLRGAFTSRLHPALRTSFPESRLTEAIARICFVFLSLGYKSEFLLPSVVKFLKTAKLSEHHSEALLSALKRNERKRLHAMGGK